jgi:hypothetical protein
MRSIADQSVRTAAGILFPRSGFMLNNRSFLYKEASFKHFFATK